MGSRSSLSTCITVQTDGKKNKIKAHTKKTKHVLENCGRQKKKFSLSSLINII